MTQDEIKKAREIIDAATPGPWSADVDGDDHDCIYSDTYGFGEEEDEWIPAKIADAYGCYDMPQSTKQANAEFIAAARRGWPKALDAVEYYKNEFNFYFKKCSDQDSEIEKLREEVAIAKERLGPAGYKMITDMRAEIEELKKAHADQMIVFAELCDEQKRSEALEAENKEQARLLGISGSKELKLITENEKLRAALAVAAQVEQEAQND